MGKRKIGEIYNKPIVEGDKNLVTNNEIHKSELSVPQSGGSEEGSANYEYLDMSTDPSHVGILEVAAYFVSVAKIAKNGEIGVSSPMMAALSGNIQASSVIAVCVDKNIKAGIDGQLFTLDEVFNSMGATTKNFYDSIPRITKEEFYSLS